MKNLFTVFWGCIIFNVSAQSWEPLGKGMTMGSIQYPNTAAVTVYNGALYAGGYFDSAGGNLVNNIAMWNGNSWLPLGTGITGSVGFINSLCVYNGQLIAAGSFTTAGGNTAYNIAAWNGTNWSALGSGIGNIQVNALMVYKGNLIAGGAFGNAGGNPVNNIAMWNGTSWSALGSGTNNPYNGYGVCVLDTFSGELYAGGEFDSAGGKLANGIAMWNGTSWSAIGSGVKRWGSFGDVYAIVAFNGELIVGGFFDTAGGIFASDIAMWNGMSWSTLSSGIHNPPSDVSSLINYGGTLIAGGSFDSAGNKYSKNIAQWNGTSWSSFGNGLSSAVGCFTIYNNNLIAGGLFDTAGGYRVNAITQWCDTCKPLEVNQLEIRNYKLEVYPNPNNGNFTVLLKGISPKNQITIFNILGEQVYQSSLNATSNQIEMSCKADGLYLYRVITETGELVGQGKFVIQK